MSVKTLSIEVLDNGFILTFMREDPTNAHWEEKREICTTEGKLIRRIKDLVDTKPKVTQLLTEAN